MTLNPFGLDATGLMVWGMVAHLIADWPLQNDWMANHKARRLTALQARGKNDHDMHYERVEVWYKRHPAAYVHALIHTALLAPVFGWPALVLGAAHLVIDTRTPVVWWSRLVRQTQPEGRFVAHTTNGGRESAAQRCAGTRRPLYDVGTEVRVWTDQVAHLTCIAIAALLLSA